MLNNTAESCEATKVVQEVKMVFLHEEFGRVSSIYVNDIAIIKVGSLFKYEKQIQCGARYVIPLIVHNTFLFLQKHLTSSKN